MNKRILSLMLVCLLVFYPFSGTRVYALTSSKLSSYPQIEYLLGAMAIETGVVWQNSSRLNQFFNDCLVKSGLTVSEFAKVVANNSATIPAWLINTVNDVIQGYKVNPTETAFDSVSVDNSTSQHWTGYPTSSISPATYPYQMIIKDAGNTTLLLVSKHYFYYATSTTIASIYPAISYGKFDTYYLNSSGSWVINQSGVSAVTVSQIFQTNQDFYTDSTGVVVDTYKNTPTTEDTQVTLDYTQDMVNTPAFPQVTANVGDVYTIPANPSTSSLIGVSSVADTGVTSATSTSIQHTDEVGILSAIKDILSNLTQTASIPYDTVKTDIINSLPVNRFTNTQHALEDMDTSKGTPPKVEFDMYAIFTASTSRFGAPTYPFDKHVYTLFDFADLENYNFGGLNLIDYFRAMIGFGFIIMTLNYMWKRLRPKEIIN